MINYLWKRLLSVLSVVFILSVFIFALIYMTPGDPARIILGVTATEEQVQTLHAEMGLDEPLYTQYLSWIAGIFHGDWGHSYYRDEQVLDSILDHLGPTMALSILAQIIAILIAIPAGVASAKNRGNHKDGIIVTASLLGLSLPSFLLSLFLILIFGVNLNLLPVAGYKPLSAGLWLHLRYLIMPAVALGAMQAALITRMTRSSMLEILHTDYIRAARAKGVKKKTILYAHALRNAFNPILTVIGQTFGTLISGAAVVETVFNIPGIGQLLVSSVLDRDYSIVQGVVLMITLIYVFINFAIDLLYGVIDPRIRITGESR